jgi:hypothetical protein
MGLLDEAIREHLELKRRRGADPGEVAREEHAALDPGHAAEPVEGGAVEDVEGQFAAGEAVVEPQIFPAGQLAPLGEETAEIDMGRVFSEDDASAGAAALGDPLAEPAFDTPPVEIPGQEKLSFE